MKLVKPKRLQRGGTIGVVSPGWWAPEQNLWAGVEMLNAMGFEVDLHDQNMFKHGQLAGTPEERVFAFHELLQDPDVDAIMFARGGYGSCQILDKLDYNLIRKAQKPIIGFSDATMILNAIQTKSGLVTFHGPMMEWFMSKPSDVTTQSFMSAMTDGDFSKYEKLGSPLRMGEAKGKLIGGNSTLLDQLVGTPYAFTEKEDVVLFFEDAGPCTRPNDMDKFLNHMKLAGVFDQVNVTGVIVEHMDTLEDNDVPFGKSVPDIYLEHFPNVPVVGNVDCGHGNHILTFPVGAQVELSAQPNDVSMTLLESPFKN